MTVLQKLAIATTGALISAALPVRWVCADTIWIGENRNAIKVDGVKVQQFHDGKLMYVTDAGMQTGKPLSSLQQINITGESSFNSAENAFAANDYDTAINGYQSVLKSSDKDWMQSRAAMRLVVAAKAKNRFDAEVSAYVALLQRDPSTAAQVRPGQPAANTPNLDAALASVASAMNNSQLSQTQKSALLGLQLQIDRAKGDASAVNATLQQMVSLGSASPSDVAMLKLASAGVAYDSKQYAQAVSLIEDNRSMFSEPDQQVDALFVLAQAKQALDIGKTDSDTLKDDGLAFMRVAVFGKQLPDRPHVAQSLYEVAQIQEKLKEPQAAMLLYKQLASDPAYAASPFVAQAKTGIDRLAKEGVSGK